MDALSELLKTIRLTGAAFVEAELKEPWSFATPPSRVLADALMPDADHVVPYHLVTRGSCSARLPGGPQVRLAAGDVVVFPQGDQHVLCASPELAPAAVTPPDLSRILARGRVTPVRWGGDGAATDIVCGFFACDRRLSAPLLDGLPRLMRVSLNGDPGAMWLQSTMRFSVAESAQPQAGAETVLAKLSELLFVETIRRYLAGLPDSQTGWLAGLRDAHIAKALALLHGRPEHDWTVDSLAREAGLSRSVLAERFTHYLGLPPMQYLTKWRLALAADQLRDGKTSIGRVAEGASYDSEAAFTRAFKREFGDPPAQWRKKALGLRKAG